MPSDCRSGWLALLLCGAAACGEPDATPGGLDLGGVPIGMDPVRDCMMQSLPRLTVVQNRLMIRCGAQTLPTRLKGINRSGLQHKNGLSMAGFADPAAELRRWRDEWKTVVVRLPIGQTYYLYYDSYRRDLDTVVAAARALGMYVMLELHGYDANNLNEQQPDPNTTPGFWADVAKRYGAETHVLFDIWNEPHDVPWSQWKGNAEKIIQAIRAAGANDTLVVVGGLDWAYDLTPVLDPQNRIQAPGPIIYATHPYPLKTNPPSMAQEWENKFGRVSDIVPVIVSEYGVDDSTTSPVGLGSKAAAHAWMAQLHSYVDQRGLSALAWSGGDQPQLTLGTSGAPVSLPQNPPDPGRPTDPFGMDVQAWMRKPL